ncbi:MAG: helix-turn-helix domain-containing protein [Microbacterium sp.]
MAQEQLVLLVGRAVLGARREEDERLHVTDPRQSGEAPTSARTRRCDPSLRGTANAPTIVHDRLCQPASTLGAVHSHGSRRILRDISSSGRDDLLGSASDDEDRGEPVAAEGEEDQAGPLREIALDATGNVGEDRVNAGQLAVFEDIARNPGTSIAGITTRTGLAQSLVSRIVRAAQIQDALTVASNEHDRRKVRIDLSPSTRTAMMRRAGNSLETVLEAHTPALTEDERSALHQHLTAAAELLSR